MNVLFSNDDSIFSNGIRALYAAAQEAGDQAQAQAPMRQQSGVSHAITVFQPLQAQPIEEENFRGMGIFGTPADCVKLALATRDQPPDMVISGINLGRNVGPDVFYSGTVGAAAEGAMAGIPSLAVSHADYHAGFDELMRAARYALALAKKIDWKKLASRRVININFPACGVKNCKGARICPQSCAGWINGYERRLDPRLAPYWWMTGDMDKTTVSRDCDIALLEDGYITITPLQFDHTDFHGLEELASMNLG